MKYWWVNQKQTYRYEVPGNYMWSPKLDRSGNHNRSYDLMRTLIPGDIVFSFANGLIKAIGVVQSYCYEFPKPTEFGAVGSNWNNIGWRVDVSFDEMVNCVKPKDNIDRLGPLLPAKYSPLQSTGDGNQAYLFDISNELAIVLAQLIDRRILDLVRGDMVLDCQKIDKSIENIKQWEDEIEKTIRSDRYIQDTEREKLIKSRVGQGKFRSDLLLIESKCRVTHVNNPTHLVASHTKPWRDSSNEERLDPENGFMMTPTIDHLFDRGFITFENNGDLIVSDVSDAGSMTKFGLENKTGLNVGKFTEGQKNYLDWHRSSIFLG